MLVRFVIIAIKNSVLKKEEKNNQNLVGNKMKKYIRVLLTTAPAENNFLTKILCYTNLKTFRGQKAVPVMTCLCYSAWFYPEKPHVKQLSHRQQVMTYCMESLSA